MATAITLSRYNDPKEINALESKGLKSVQVAYASTSALTPVSAYKQIVNYAQLTGAMTINATVTNLNQWDELIFVFEADSSQRIVTFGTNFLSSGTVTVTASKGATVYAIFDGTNIRIMSREIYA